MQIRELMTADVVTIGPDASLKEAARRMLEAGVSGLPVVDADGRLIGIITEADFVSAEADRRQGRRRRLLAFLVREDEMPAKERRVGDVMTEEVAVISPEADHADAARLMEKERVKRLPVVEDDRIVGIVSRTDILRAFVRPDEDIVEEIREQVMRHVLWIDPNRVEIECVDGNVVLTGRLETRSDANLLVELTRRLDGVVSVKDRLTWEVDNTKVEMVGPPPSRQPPKPDW